MPASAQLRPASGSDIGAAVATCIKATRPAGVDLQSLAADGWQQATMELDGKAVEAAKGLYGRTNSPVLLLVPQEANAPKMCVAMARIASPELVPAIATGITGAMGAQPARKGSEYTWFRSRLAVNLAAAGTAKEPGLRIAVIALSQEAK